LIAARPPDGYQQLLDVARAHVPGRRCWAVEGAGSYGAGLTAFLHAHGERVVEAARPKRPASRTGAKTDPIDAVGAGRDALAQEHLALPRCRGDRAALQVLLATRRHATASRVAAINQLKALIVGAPEELRGELRGMTTSVQITRCAGLRDRPARPPGHRMTVRVLRTTAGRIQYLQAEIDELGAELATLVDAVAPWLVDLGGVGPITAAQVLVSWSYAGRLRLRSSVCVPGRDQPDPGFVGAGHPPPAEPIRGPAAQSCLAHDRPGAPPR